MKVGYQFIMHFRSILAKFQCPCLLQDHLLLASNRTSCFLFIPHPDKVEEECHLLLDLVWIFTILISGGKAEARMVVCKLQLLLQVDDFINWLWILRCIDYSECYKPLPEIVSFYVVVTNLRCYVVR